MPRISEFCGIVIEMYFRDHPWATLAGIVTVPALLISGLFDHFVQGVVVAAVRLVHDHHDPFLERQQHRDLQAVGSDVHLYADVRP